MSALALGKYLSTSENYLMLFVLNCCSKQSIKAILRIFNGDIEFSKIHFHKLNHMFFKKAISFLFICSMLFFSCATSNNSSTSESKSPRTVDSANEKSMSELMQKLSGVIVSGSGNNTTVRVMVGNYFSEPFSEPLFLLNGVSFSNDFLSVQNSINPQDVESVQVYKTPSELGRYGVRGVHGVIDIELK